MVRRDIANAERRVAIGVRVSSSTGKALSNGAGATADTMLHPKPQQSSGWESE